MFNAPLKHLGVLRGVAQPRGLKNCFGKEYLKEGGWKAAISLGLSRLVHCAPCYAKGGTQMLFSPVSVSTGAKNPYMTP